MKNTILTGIVGSRAYGFDIAGSDTDIMGIFVASKDQRLDPEFKPTVAENNATFHEIGKFCELLAQGDPAAIEFLCLDSYTWRSPRSHCLSKNAWHFITKDTLIKWLHIASSFYSRSLRIGAFHADDKQAIDFMTFYSSPLGGKGIFNEPLRSTLLRGAFFQQINVTTESIPLDKIGLLPIEDNFYYLYFDFSSDALNVRGLVEQNDENKVIKDGVIATNGHKITCVGVIKYDEAEHKKYLRLKASIQANKVISGYAPKSMMHAFRLVEKVNKFIDTNKIPVKVENPAYYHKIRTGTLSRQDLIDHFKELFYLANSKLEKYKYTSKDLDSELIPSILKEIRTQYDEESSETDHQHRWVL